MYTTRSAAHLLILLCAPHALADDAPGALPGVPAVPNPVVDTAESDEVIVVESQASEPAELRIPAAQLREVPGALGDPVRAVTSLPGVVPTTANRPDVYIRGAPPGNTGYFLDGIRVPLLFHSGVVSSVVPPALVDAVGFFASAAPARYSGVAGGAIEIETAAPAPQRRAELTMKLYEGGGLVESPLADGRGSVLAAARLGYPQLVTAMTGSDVRLAYWDYQARASWALGHHDRVSVLAFGSHDRIGEDERTPEMPEETYIEQLASDFHRVDLRYDHTRAASHLRVALTGGWGAQGAADISVRHLTYGARAEGDVRLAATLQGRAGLQLQRDIYRLPAAVSDPDDPSISSPASADPAPRNVTAGGYADVVWDPRDDLRLTPGVRFDVYASHRAVDGASGSIPVVEPRLGVRWRLRPSLSVLLAGGFAHQYPLLRVGSAPATAVTVPGFWAGERQLQHARQASAGAEWLLPGAFTAIATGFGSVTRGLTDLRRTCESGRIMMPAPGMPDEPAGTCGDTPSRGVAYGLELSLRRPLTERLAGWLSYTLSRATERPTDPAVGTWTVPSAFNRTHVASASIAYQVSAGWRAGARGIAYSGVPLLLPAREDGTVPARDLRQPWFYRVDLRAERRWDLARGSSISLVFDLLNATLSREHIRIDCGAANPQAACITSQNLFVLPSIGIEASL